MTQKTRRGRPAQAKAKGKAPEVAALKVVVADRIQLWPIDQLVPYERNPRTHTARQLDKFVRIIARFGFTDPILVDEASGILAGHLRLAAARKLGLDQVPVVELSYMDAATKRAFIIAHNRIAEDSGWDEDFLRGEMIDLESADFDLDLTGFEEEEIEQLLEEVEEAPQGSARVGKIIVMLEFDNRKQRDRWHQFVAWVRGKVAGKSAGAALVEHGERVMKSRRAPASRRKR